MVAKILVTKCKHAGHGGLPAMAHREAPGTATSDYFWLQFLNVRVFAVYGLKYVIYIC